MEVDNIISYINLAGMLIAPVGFFFWVKFKIGQTEEQLVELKQLHKEDCNDIRHAFREDLLSVKHGKTALKKDLQDKLKEYKEDQKEINDGLRKDIIQLRNDISASKSEILTAISNIK